MGTRQDYGPYMTRIVIFKKMIANAEGKYDHPIPQLWHPERNGAEGSAVAFSSFAGTHTMKPN
jgi:hypothetical protein